MSSTNKLISVRRAIDKPESIAYYEIPKPIRGQVGENVQSMTHDLLYDMVRGINRNNQHDT